MAKTGRSFITTLKEPHLQWGVYRHTDTRGPVSGEGYIQISADDADQFEITNNSFSGRSAEYIASTADGFLKAKTLLASGSQGGRKSEFAKQFQGLGDLKLIGTWFNHIGAKVGDRIEVKFISENEILLTKL